jgi:hypothetical protein
VAHRLLQAVALPPQRVALGTQQLVRITVAGLLLQLLLLRIELHPGCNSRGRVQRAARAAAAQRRHCCQPAASLWRPWMSCCGCI